MEESKLDSFAARLRAFYEVYNPSMITAVESVLAQNRNHEEELMSDLTERYGPEPPQHTADEVPDPVVAGTTVGVNPSDRLKGISETNPPLTARHEPSTRQVDVKPEVVDVFLRYFKEVDPPMSSETSVRSMLAVHKGEEVELCNILEKNYGRRPNFTASRNNTSNTNARQYVSPSQQHGTMIKERGPTTFDTTATIAQTHKHTAASLPDVLVEPSDAPQQNVSNLVASHCMNSRAKTGEPKNCDSIDSNAKNSFIVKYPAYIRTWSDDENTLKSAKSENAGGANLTFDTDCPIENTSMKKGKKMSQQVLCHTCLHQRIQHEPRSGTACSQICVTGNPSPHEWTSHPPYAPHMGYPHMGPRDVLLGSNQNAVAPGYAHVHHHLHTANATPDSKMSSRYFNRNNRSVQGKMVQYEPHPYYSIVDSSTDRTHRLSHLSLFDSPNHFYPDASRGITRIEEECPYRNRGGSTNRRYSPCDWIHSAAPEDSVLPLCVHPGHVQRTEATEGTDGRKSIVLCCTCGLPRSSCNHD